MSEPSSTHPGTDMGTRASTIGTYASRARSKASSAISSVFFPRDTLKRDLYWGGTKIAAAALTSALCPSYLPHVTTAAELTTAAMGCCTISKPMTGSHSRLLEVFNTIDGGLKIAEGGGTLAGMSILGCTGLNPAASYAISSVASTMAGWAGRAAFLGHLGHLR